MPGFLCIKRTASTVTTAGPLKVEPAVAAPVQNQTSSPRATLFPPSPEQQKAVDVLLHTNDNLIVDACAGSGKTTTILHLAASAPWLNFLVLVYNRRLMLETAERVDLLKLKNVTVLNYHVLGVQYYSSECSTDQGLKRVVQDNMPVFSDMKLPDFSVLVMDEQQDMTPILKRFVDKVIRDKGFVGKNRRPKKSKNAKELRIMVLGDRRQEVYGFNNADSRFLTMAERPEVFGYVNKNPWTWADQTTSNRVTQQNVEFINEQMLKKPFGEGMRAVRNQRPDGLPYPRPRYVICDSRQDVLGEVMRLINVLDLLPTEIIILAPSVRGQSPAIPLANSLSVTVAEGLSTRGIPVYRADSDIAEIAPEVAHGKILICTYHQAKGIERRASILLGFDAGYHLLYNKVDKMPSAATNPQYVAATRALEHLVLIHDYRYAPLPFVNLESVSKTCDFIEARPLAIEPPPVKRRLPLFGVTALCRNVSETLITDCLKKLDFEKIASPRYGIDAAPGEITDKYGLLEEVASITGTAVPAIYEWRQNRKLTILQEMLKYLEPLKRRVKEPHPLRMLPDEFYDKLAAISKASESGRVTTNDILFVANLVISNINKDITKIINLPLEGYGWFSEAHSEDIHCTINGIPGPAKVSSWGLHFERMNCRRFDDITHGGGPTNPEKKHGMVLQGVMDMCRYSSSGRTVWEIKNSMSLQPEHLLQTALYMLLLERSQKAESEPGPRPPPEPVDIAGFLVSTRTGQTIRVLPRTSSSLMEVLQLLVDSKSGGVQSTRLLSSYSDAEFLAESESGFKRLVSDCALPAWIAAKPSGSKYDKRKKKS